ncbi:MAG: hypothetical protein WC812_01120 [Candidatus Pacearchaeota archaeon]|jgi:hypothetical protein
MGFIRGVGVFLLCFILFLSLFFMNVFLNLNWSLEHDTLEPNLINYANDFINSSGISQDVSMALTVMEFYCMTHTNYIFNYQDFNIDIPCNVVDYGVKNATNYIISSLVDKIYYQEYNCEFWTCVKTSEVPVVFISEKAKDYWFYLFKISIIISIIAFVLMLLITRKKANAFINTGVLVLASSILFRESKLLLKIFPNNPILDFLEIFFAKANTIFIIMIIIGVVFLIVGILLRFLNIGTKISQKLNKEKDEKVLSKEDVKQAVREELEEEKKSKKKKISKKK